MLRSRIITILKKSDLVYLHAKEVSRDSENTVQAGRSVSGWRAVRELPELARHVTLVAVATIECDARKLVIGGGGDQAARSIEA